jgi:hypothetical protein
LHIYYLGNYGIKILQLVHWKYRPISQLDPKKNTYRMSKNQRQMSNTTENIFLTKYPHIPYITVTHI